MKNAPILAPRRAGVLLLAACLLLCAVGCAAPAMQPDVTAEPTRSPVITPAPSPTPAPVVTPDYASLTSEAEAAFRGAFTLDFSSVTLPEMGYITELMANFDAFSSIDGLIEAAASRAFSAAFAAVSAAYPALPAGALTCDAPGWQMLMSLYRALGRSMDALLVRHYTLEVICDADGVRATLSFPGLRELLEDDAFSSESACGAKTLYAYLCTIYDDAGAETDYIQPELEASYLATLADPLPRRNIKDGWYNPRSQSTRKHTGTDIRAAAGEDILSCTGGVILHIGTGELSGNYVAVLDDYGYEYHYYHMIERTDFLAEGDRVQAGDVIGHVGNTGNSDANHLHLTIISPTFYYVNPYPVLVAVRELARAN